jgi:hypothetical protein
MNKKADMKISSRAFPGLKQASVLPILAAVILFVAFAGANAMAEGRENTATAFPSTYIKFRFPASDPIWRFSTCMVRRTSHRPWMLSSCGPFTEACRSANCSASNWFAETR